MVRRGPPATSSREIHATQTNRPPATQSRAQCPSPRSSRSAASGSSAQAAARVAPSSRVESLAPSFDVLVEVVLVENLIQSRVEGMRGAPRQVLSRYPYRRLLRAPSSFAHRHRRQCRTWDRSCRPYLQHGTTRMTNTIGAIVGVLLICAASPLAGPMQSGSVQTVRWDHENRVGRPSTVQVNSRCQRLGNPYLIIRRDGIEVMVKRLPSSRKTVAAADLARMLIGLPVTAWPYGRVVAVQEMSIREADRSDDKSIADNLEVALAILKKLDVTVDKVAQLISILFGLSPRAA